MYYCYLFSSTTRWLKNNYCAHFPSHQKIIPLNFGNNMALPLAPSKYGTHIQADQTTSLNLGVRSAVSPSCVSPSFSLTSVCVLLFKAAWSSALFVSRKPLLCFGILLSVRSGCTLTEARGITPQLSSTHKRA